MRQASEWIGRTLAASVIMAGPGLLGYWADRQLGIRMLTPLGFVVGMVIGTVALLALIRKNPLNGKSSLERISRTPGEQGAAEREFGQNDSPQDTNYPGCKKPL